MRGRLYNYYPFCGPGIEAMVIIVVSLPCTAYQCGSLIALQKVFYIMLPMLNSMLPRAGVDL